MYVATAPANHPLKVVFHFPSAFQFFRSLGSVFAEECNSFFAFIFNCHIKCSPCVTFTCACTNYIYFSSFF